MDTQKEIEIWKSICPICRQIVFYGNVPDGTKIIVKCVNCSAILEVADRYRVNPRLIGTPKETIPIPEGYNHG